MARQIGRLGAGIVENAHPSSRKQRCAFVRTLGQAAVTADPPAMEASCTGSRRTLDGCACGVRRAW
eukprot:1303466-Prymnesium_polylepis.1